jgi:hypothetical protein
MVRRVYGHYEDGTWTLDSTDYISVRGLLAPQVTNMDISVYGATSTGSIDFYVGDRQPVLKTSDAVGSLIADRVLANDSEYIVKTATDYKFAHVYQLVRDIQND